MTEPQNGQFVVGYIVNDRNTELGKYSGLYWDGFVYIMILSKPIRIPKCIPRKSMKRYFKYTGIAIQVKHSKLPYQFLRLRHYFLKIFNVPEFITTLDLADDYDVKNPIYNMYKFRIEKI